MFMVADKWCVPMWLLDAIKNKIDSNKHLDSINVFINNLTNNRGLCKVCKLGFDINNNTYQSCKTHTCYLTILNTNQYACCNKEEPCKIGYHIADEQYLEKIINTIKNLPIFK